MLRPKDLEACSAIDADDIKVQFTAGWRAKYSDFLARLNQPPPPDFEHRSALGANAAWDELSIAQRLTLASRMALANAERLIAQRLAPQPANVASIDGFICAHATQKLVDDAATFGPGPVVLRLRSPGGFSTAAVKLGDALTRDSGGRRRKLVLSIPGFCASAATILIPMANYVLATPDATIAFHGHQAPNRFSLAMQTAEDASALDNDAVESDAVFGESLAKFALPKFHRNLESAGGLHEFLTKPEFSAATRQRLNGIKTKSPSAFFRKFCTSLHAGEDLNLDAETAQALGFVDAVIRPKIRETKTNTMAEIIHKTPDKLITVEMLRGVTVPGFVNIKVGDQIAVEGRVAWDLLCTSPCCAKLVHGQVLRGVGGELRCERSGQRWYPDPLR